MSEIIQIREDTWRIEDNGVRFFVLTGKERAVMIDSGMNTPNDRELAESITSLPLTLLNTHVDIDHISGNAAFESVMMSENEAELYRSKGFENTVIPLKHGDVINLGQKQGTSIYLEIGGYHWFTGQMGTHNKNMAVKIEDVCYQAERRSE